MRVDFSPFSEAASTKKRSVTSFPQPGALRTGLAADPQFAGKTPRRDLPGMPPTAEAMPPRDLHGSPFFGPVQDRFVKRAATPDNGVSGAGGSKNASNAPKFGMLTRSRARNARHPHASVGQLAAPFRDRNAFAILAQGDVRLMGRWLTAGGRDLNVTNAAGSTLLMEAILRNRKPMIQLLLGYAAAPARHGGPSLAHRRRGFDLDHRNREGKTALHLAVASDDAKLVDDLVKAGASLDIQDKWGRTPLMEATRLGNMKAIERLVALGADPNLPSARGVSPFRHAVYRMRFVGPGKPTTSEQRQAWEKMARLMAEKSRFSKELAGPLDYRNEQAAHDLLPFIPDLATTWQQLKQDYPIRQAGLERRFETLLGAALMPNSKNTAAISDLKQILRNEPRLEDSAQLGLFEAAEDGEEITMRGLLHLVDGEVDVLWPLSRLKSGNRPDKLNLVFTRLLNAAREEELPEAQAALHRVGKQPASQSGLSGRRVWVNVNLADKEGYRSMPKRKYIPSPLSMTATAEEQPSKRKKT